MSNSLNADQEQYHTKPDLATKCLQRLSAEVTSRQRVKQVDFGKTCLHQADTC